jgi:predicted transposase YbfD/YdcC
MQEWCVNYQKRLHERVPFLAGHMPNSATFHRVFAQLDVVTFEEVIGSWLEAITPLAKGEGIGLDGKSLHGTNLHLVAAFAHRARAVLFEMGTETKGKELVVGPEVLTHITIKDRVVTGDALFTQRALCEQIEKAKGGYVFRVKGNQDTLEKNIRLFFKEPPFQANIRTHTTIDRWKGVKEERAVSVSDDSQLLEYLSWPGLTHVWEMQKTVTKKNAEGILETTTTTSVGITRIPEEILEGGKEAQQITGLIRGHWGIENSLHRTRDVTFKEDNSTIRKGHAPQTMAILRNIVTSLFHRGTVRSFPTAMRRFAAHPEELFTFLGLTTVQKAHAYA